MFTEILIFFPHDLTLARHSEILDLICLKLCVSVTSLWV